MMQIVFDKRESGKTDKLIDYCSKNNVYMVCKDFDEVDRVNLRAIEIKKPLINFPITFHDFMTKRYYGKGIRGFVIDNADLILQYISNDVPIEMISLTKVSGPNIKIMSASPEKPKDNIKHITLDEMI
jgi:hypothetical protein